MTGSEHRAFGRADEVRTFPHGKVDVLAMGQGEVGRLTLGPGWRWSTGARPTCR